jgi:ceramide glucosyltransferase
MHVLADLCSAALLLLLGLTVWKHLAVVRCFRRPIPPLAVTPQLVSILQPILSGDPTLPATLGHNLRLPCPAPVEFLWLVDDEDGAGQAICRTLMAAQPAANVRLIALPRPPQGNNPKTFKLSAGLAQARGDVICVLDDDTMLPERWQMECLPLLYTPDAGLVFGLPYQVNFANIWSALVAGFVNSSSLLTYIPYTRLHEPVTINGMFYAMRRDLLETMGGWQGLEKVLADDFAVAQRVRQHGYKLVQAPLRHAISTTVRDGRHYLNLIQRWFIFPRESILRHLPLHEQGIVYGLALFPALMPLVALLIAGWLAWFAPQQAVLPGVLLLLYLGYHFAIFLHFNAAFFGGATPRRRMWVVPFLQIIFPIQLLAALMLPQRINWRGHVIQVQRGGGFRYLRRR